MSLFAQLMIGTFMIAATVFFQAIGLDLIMRHTKQLEAFLKRHAKTLWRPTLSAVVVVEVFTVNVVQMWVWAFLFMQLHCKSLETLADALHFSTILYTTLGLSNIDPGESCRMLSGVEGANGILLFGWTTAFIFEVITQLYRKEAKELED